MIVPPPTPQHLLPHTVTINQYVWTADATSGTPAVSSTASILTTIRAFVQPQTGQDALVYGRETGTLGYDIYLSPTDINGTAVTVYHSDTIAYGSLTLRVTGVLDDLCNLGTLLHVVAEVVK